MLDDVIDEFDARFNKLSPAAGHLVSPVPSLICEREVSIEDASEVYAHDLSSPELLDQEIDQWKKNF